MKYQLKEFWLCEITANQTLLRVHKQPVLLYENGRAERQYCSNFIKRMSLLSLEQAKLVS